MMGPTVRPHLQQPQLERYPDRDELVELARSNAKLRITSCVTDESPPARPDVVPGRVTRELLADRLGDDVWARDYFLCGPPPFMESMRVILSSMGVHRQQIHTEGFGVAPRQLFGEGWLPKVVYASWLTAAALGVGLVFRIEQARQAAKQIRYNAQFVGAINGYSSERRARLLQVQQDAIAATQAEINARSFQLQTASPTTPQADARPAGCGNVRDHETAMGPGQVDVAPPD